jgi:hypothetical protein
MSDYSDKIGTDKLNITGLWGNESPSSLEGDKSLVEEERLTHFGLKLGCWLKAVATVKIRAIGAGFWGSLLPRRVIISLQTFWAASRSEAPYH